MNQGPSNANMQFSSVYDTVNEMGTQTTDAHIDREMFERYNISFNDNL